MLDSSGQYLLPGHRHVLQELVHGVWHELQGSQIDTLVVSEFPGGHVTVVLHMVKSKLRLEGMGGRSSPGLRGQSSNATLRQRSRFC